LELGASYRQAGEKFGDILGTIRQCP